jgi:hypothetical protein
MDGLGRPVCGLAGLCPRVFLFWFFIQFTKAGIKPPQ